MPGFVGRQSVFVRGLEGDKEMGRQGDGETRRQGDGETRRWGADRGMAILAVVSPCSTGFQRFQPETSSRDSARNCLR